MHISKSISTSESGYVKKTEGGLREVWEGRGDVRNSLTAHINHATALTDMSNNFTARFCHSTMHGIFSQACVELVLRSFFPSKSGNNDFICYSCVRDSVLILQVEQ